MGFSVCLDIAIAPGLKPGSMGSRQAASSHSAQQSRPTSASPILDPGYHAQKHARVAPFEAQPSRVHAKRKPPLQVTVVNRVLQMCDWYLFGVDIWSALSVFCQ